MPRTSENQLLVPFIMPDSIVEMRRGEKIVLFDRLKLNAIDIDWDLLDKAKAFREPKLASVDVLIDMFGRTMLDLEFIRPVILAGGSRAAADATHTERPRSVINTYRLVLLEGCNWACTYCFEKDNAPYKHVMQEETLDGILDHIIEKHRGGEVAIHWFGGEPLLQYRLIRRGVERLAGYLRSGGLASVSHSLTTHGGQVTPEIASFLAEHAFRVFVSIDGDRETTNQFRRDRKGRGTYDLAMAGYWLLAAAGLNVGFLLTPIEQTVDRLADSVRYLVEETSCRRIGVNTPQPTPDGWRIDGEILARQLIEVTLYCAERGVELTAPSQRILRALITRTPHVKDCRAPSGAMAMSVAPDGRMSHCIVSWNSLAHSSASRDQVAYTTATDWKLASHATDVCRTCVAEMVCGGPCALEAELHGLDTQRCNFFQVFVQEALLLGPTS